MKLFLLYKKYAPWVKLALVLGVIVVIAILGGAPDITGP